MLIKQIGEFGLINKIKKIVDKGEGLITPIGDDCAAVQISKNKLGLLTTDSLIEDIHFKLSYTTPLDLGYKALVVNISDIASMAGKPKYALISLAMPDETSVKFVRELYKGLKQAAYKYNVSIAGGDISRSPKALMINISIYGEADPKLLRRRSQAKAGQLIFVTGSLGGSAAGLKLLKNPKLETSSTLFRKLTKKHLRPEARVAEGLLTSKNGAQAMEDISDGLISEIGHICEESQVGAIIYVEKVPVDPDIHKIPNLATNSLSLALTGGEDYELVFTAPVKKSLVLKKAFKEKGYPLYQVGEITLGRDIIVVNKDGNRIKLDSGYEHFR